MKLELFTVSPLIPQRIRFVETLSRNLWWNWHSDAIDLFKRINPDLWEEYEHNPIMLLNYTSQARFNELAESESFCAHLDEVKEKFDDYMKNADSCNECIAYFSMEYGIHNSIGIYSGGLGILAGDHMKTASDLDYNMVGVGLFYRQGYFQQRLTDDGWQQEFPTHNVVHTLPVSKVCSGKNEPLIISIPLPEGELNAEVWKVEIGKTTLLLLDANTEDNPYELRKITDQLYPGDAQLRLRQELLLGIGGFEVLQKCGYTPHAYHINESHAVFLNLAYVAHLCSKRNFSVDQAVEIALHTNIFTIHTPVAAGNEAFRLDLIYPHLKALEARYGISAEKVCQLAQLPDKSERDDSKTWLSLTVLGLRMSRYANGVSRLHGHTARNIWKHLWPQHQRDEVPITQITNGIHLDTWISDRQASLFERYLNPEWKAAPDDEEQLRSIDAIPDEELWQAHTLTKSTLIGAIYDHIEKTYARKGKSKRQIDEAKPELDNNALTIGFSRRFTAYKRAGLLLHDIERLKAIISNDKRPVQFVFAGKAHPRDDEGKELIKRVLQLSQDEAVKKRVVFLEDYSMNIAKKIVQGVDVWLNVPRRPLEASGTSGMKAAINGAINLSVLDGWWDEAYNGINGWRIGNREEFEDHHYQDMLESAHLYEVLENQVIPLYYSREGSIPRQWISMMRESIKTVLECFSSITMLKNYYERFYAPAKVFYREFIVSEPNEYIANMHSRQEALREKWDNLAVYEPETEKELTDLHINEGFTVSVVVYLGEMDPEDVSVEIYYGIIDTRHNVTEGKVMPMEKVKVLGDGKYEYRQQLSCAHAGRYGFTARLVPAESHFKNVIPGLVKWAGTEES